MPEKTHSVLWLARNRQLWGSAHKIGMEESDLRYLVKEVTGSESISGLSEREQIQVLSALDLLKVHTYQKRRHQKKRLDPAPKGRATEATVRQVEMIRTLAGKIGWGDAALRAWLKRWHRVDHEKWLTASKAGRAIQGLRAIVAREKANAQRAV